MDGDERKIINVMRTSLKSHPSFPPPRQAQGSGSKRPRVSTIDEEKHERRKLQARAYSANARKRQDKVSLADACLFSHRGLGSVFLLDAPGMTFLSFPSHACRTLGSCGYEWSP